MLGVTADEPLVHVSTPVKADDATRTEALGPPIAMLLLTSLALPSHVILRGDSSHVVDLLSLSRQSHDLFLYNCAEITKDFLSDWRYTAEWIPRD